MLVTSTQLAALRFSPFSYSTHKKGQIYSALKMVIVSDFSAQNTLGEGGEDWGWLIHTVALTDHTCQM